jgi:hypothetical protein
MYTASWAELAAGVAAAGCSCSNPDLGHCVKSAARSATCSSARTYPLGSIHARPTHPPGPGRARGVCADSARCGRGRRERCKYVVYSSALLQYFSNYSGPGGCAVPPRPRLHCLQTSGGGRNHGLAQHRFSCFESVVTSAAAIVRNSRAFAKSPGTSHFARAWYCTLCLSFQLRAAAQ